MNEYEKDSSGQAAPGGPVESMGSAPVPQQSFGPAPDGEQEMGDAPRPSETMGDAPGKPQPPAPPPAVAGNKNMAWLIGGVIAILVIVAAIFGFAMR